MHINFVTLFFVAAILLLNSGYHILFENQAVWKIFYENSMPNITTWIQPSPTAVFTILELEWTKFHKSKHYGSEIFHSKSPFFLVKKHISRSAHRTPNFTNPEYFGYLLFEYFFQIKVLN